MQQSITSATETQQIIDTAKNYVLAFKNTAPSLVSKHFTKDFIKTGFFFLHEQNKWDEIRTHGFDEVKKWTSTYNKDQVMPDTEINVSLLEISDKLAVVKIIAEWAPGVKGLDFVILVKQENDWKIRSVSWQTII
jgi:hypothetical protein